ncbi:MAB_1171c family putative transporter [Streptomyces sp. NPDC005476]|uniref:MAB_1171c family putative transporter n=1 Tax=Streptomyces sp. NPDC005476 TaxID=3156882 RepID=UPI00345252D6
MNHGLYVSFWLPTVVLGAALAIKLPSILKLWRDPLLRAVGGLLIFACAVFVFAAPKTIAWTNRVTGVPNIAAPWVYSLLTALSASWLLLIIAWRNGRSERSAQTRRATRWVVSVYAGVVVALWVLFALADVPVEQIQDLDTYYANTPFMREEILLYLLAHTVACSVTARLVWNWSRTEGLDAWLRWGLRFLGAGYVTNLLFSAAKLTAVGARWTGHDLDWLNTSIAPSAACIAATLVAIGFIVPHAGQYLQERWRVRRRHRSLKPLSRLMRGVTGAREPFALRATPELRLIRRETFIRDALLQLARHLDDDLRARSYEAAVALGFERGRAQALAAAVTLLDALDARQRALRQPESAEPTTAAEPERPASSTSPIAPSGSSRPDTTYLLREIQAVSHVLRHPDDIQAVRAHAAAPAESMSTHE